MAYWAPTSASLNPYKFIKFGYFYVIALHIKKYEQVLSLLIKIVYKVFDFDLNPRHKKQMYVSPWIQYSVLSL